MMVLLIVALSASMAVSSCSKDNDDDPSSSSSSSLVGTWYYMEDGDFDYDDFFVFKSNGSFNYADEDYGTYKFNEQNSTLTLNWGDGDVEKIYVEFIAKNIIYLDDWGMYKKK